MMFIGKKKEKPETEETEEAAGPSLNEMGSKQAAKGILAAIEGGDSAALAKALKAFMEACSGDDE